MHRSSRVTPTPKPRRIKHHTRGPARYRQSPTIQAATTLPRLYVLWRSALFISRLPQTWRACHPHSAPPRHSPTSSFLFVRQCECLIPPQTVSIQSSFFDPMQLGITATPVLCLALRWDSPSFPAHRKPRWRHYPAALVIFFTKHEDYTPYTRIISSQHI